MVDAPIEVAEFCAGELAGCTGEGTGDLSCGELVDCTNECMGDADCETNCFNTSSMDAQAAYVGLIYCMFEYCPMFDQMCVEGALAPMGACFDYADACWG
jgi:hypothetical protein